LWVGETAKEFTTTNLSDAFDGTRGANTAANKLPGRHGAQSLPYLIDMQYNTLYLFRIVQGDGGGANVLRFGYKEPHGLIRWDLTYAFRF